MSEYLSKKAVLESISEAYQTSLEDSDQADWEEGYRSALRFVKRTIQSGALDAPDGEVQRLREALHKITQIYDDPNLHDLTACHEMNRVAKEALSTTIEPTNCKRKAIERLETELKEENA